MPPMTGFYLPTIRGLINQLFAQIKQSVKQSKFAA